MATKFIEYPGNVKLVHAMTSLGRLLGLDTKSLVGALQLDDAILDSQVFKLDTTFLVSANNNKLGWWPRKSTFQILMLDGERNIRGRISMFHDDTVRPLFSKQEYTNYMEFRQHVIKVEFPKLNHTILTIMRAVKRITAAAKRARVQRALTRSLLVARKHNTLVTYLRIYSINVIKSACLRTLPSVKFTELVWDHPEHTLMAARDKAKFAYLNRIKFQFGCRPKRIVRRG